MVGNFEVQMHGFNKMNGISVLHHGEIIASGNPEEVRNDPEVRRIYLGEGIHGAA